MFIHDYWNFFQLFQIKEATDLINEYNERLQQELKDRKKVGKMIVNFLASQTDLLTKAEENLELHRDKLDKVNAIRDDLKSHIQSLPDLRQLPDVEGEQKKSTQTFSSLEARIDEFLVQNRKIPNFT